MRLVVVAILVTLSACSQWPRMANLPTEEGIPAEDGVASLVDITWLNVDSDDADNDQPNGMGVTIVALTPGDGIVFDAQLDGIGWDNSGEPSPLADENCPQATGTRAPLADQGDYIGDVDFLRISATASGTLCAEVVLDQASVGWDLAARPVDDCGIPTGGPIDDAGISAGGAQGGWQLQVAAGESIALSFAGYSPNDLALTVGYSIALALVPDASDGSPGLCPASPLTAEAR